VHVIAGGDPPAGDRHAGDRDFQGGGRAGDVEDAAGVVAADDQVARPRPRDRHRVGDVQGLPADQEDGLEAAEAGRAEVDGVGAGGGVGLVDGPAQAAHAVDVVVGVGDREGG